MGGFAESISTSAALTLHSRFMLMGFARCPLSFKFHGPGTEASPRSHALLLGIRTICPLVGAAACAADFGSWNIYHGDCYDVLLPR